MNITFVFLCLLHILPKTDELAKFNEASSVPINVEDLEMQVLVSHRFDSAFVLSRLEQFDEFQLK